MPTTWAELLDLGDREPRRRRGRRRGRRRRRRAERRRGIFKRLRESLATSRQALGAELGSSLFENLDAEAWERLEEALIMADVGARTTAEVVGRLEAEVEAGQGRGRRGRSAPGWSSCSPSWRRPAAARSTCGRARRSC